MTTLITASFIVFGIFAYKLLSVSALPRVDFPTIEITATLNGASVKYTIALRPGRPDGRPLSAIQHAVLNAGVIGGQAHQAAEGVDLTNHLALADAAHRRVAAHAADGFALHGHQGRGNAKPRGRPGCLGPGMAPADHNDLEVGRHWRDMVVV